MIDQIFDSDYAHLRPEDDDLFSDDENEDDTLLERGGVKLEGASDDMTNGKEVEEVTQTNGHEAKNGVVQNGNDRVRKVRRRLFRSGRKGAKSQVLTLRRYRTHLHRMRVFQKRNGHGWMSQGRMGPSRATVMRALLRVRCE